MLPIPINPYSEKLSGSINFNGDKFCATCNKRIYNFSRMSDEELIAFLSKPKENACGIFDSSQVIESTPMDVSNLKRRTTWKSIFATLAATVISFTAFAQVKKDSTKIISPNNFTIIPSDSNQTKNRITIEGVVRDSATGKPLELSSILVIDSSNKIIDSTFKPSNGSFKFSISQNEFNRVNQLKIVLNEYESKFFDFKSMQFKNDVFIQINISPKLSSKLIEMPVGFIINEEQSKIHINRISGEEIRRMPR